MIEVTLSLVEIDSWKAIVKWQYESKNVKRDTSGKWIRQTIPAHSKDCKLIFQKFTSSGVEETNESDLWLESQQYAHACVPPGLELRNVGSEELSIDDEILRCEVLDASVKRSLPPRMKQVSDFEGFSLPRCPDATMRYWLSEQVPGGLVKSTMIDTGVPGYVPDPGWALRSFVRISP